MTTETFDYIIVGAGSAGSVLANRLSANGVHSVLVLEDPVPHRVGEVSWGCARFLSPQFWCKTPISLCC